MAKYSNVKKFAGLFGILLVFPLTFVLVFNSMDHKFDSLPYFGDTIVVDKSENGVLTQDSIHYQIPDFQLNDQSGNVFLSDSLKGTIYLAAFYSTNSPYISKITKRLLAVNFKYRNEPNIAIVCFSLDPAHDTPKTLKSYTDELRVDPEKFIFLTSADSSVFDVIENAYLLEDYQNSSTIWLVDTEGFLRGKYDGNTEEEIQRASEDIALLKKELDSKLYNQRKQAE